MKSQIESAPFTRAVFLRRASATTLALAVGGILAQQRADVPMRIPEKRRPSGQPGDGRCRHGEDWAHVSEHRVDLIAQLPVAPVVEGAAERLDGFHDRHAAERHAADHRVRTGSKPRWDHDGSRRSGWGSSTRQRPLTRRADRAVVQHGRLRAAGTRAGRNGRSQHHRRSRVSQRRSRPLP